MTQSISPIVELKRFGTYQEADNGKRWAVSNGPHYAVSPFADEQEREPMEIRNLTKPLLINGRWYDCVKIWGHAAGDALCVTPAHYKTGRRCWIVFADQLAA